MYSNKLTIKTFLAFFFFLRILTSFPSLIVKGWQCFKSIRQGALRTRQTFRNPKVFSFFLTARKFYFHKFPRRCLNWIFFIVLAAYWTNLLNFLLSRFIRANIFCVCHTVISLLPRNNFFCNCDKIVAHVRKFCAFIFVHIAHVYVCLLSLKVNKSTFVKLYHRQRKVK